MRMLSKGSIQGNILEFPSLGRAIGDSVHGGGLDILPTRHGPLETISASGVGHGGGVLEYVLPDLMDRVHFIVGYYASF
jgi:hypothetical protein